jgi:hypothetical protein
MSKQVGLATKDLLFVLAGWVAPTCSTYIFLESLLAMKSRVPGPVSDDTHLVLQVGKKRTAIEPPAVVRVRASRMKSAELFSHFQAWAREEAGIVFPKVKVSILPAQALSSPSGGCPDDEDDCATPHTDDNAEVAASTGRLRSTSPLQRGLFATETIFPGERILLVPSSSLLGAGALQRLGSQLLLKTIAAPDAEGEEADASRDRNENGPRRINARTGEAFVLASIERLRRILHREDASSNETARIAQAAQDVGFEWREDDAVAVYLACCRSLLKGDPGYAPTVSVHDSDRIAAPRHDAGTVPGEDALPPITDAVPLTEDLHASVAEGCEVKVGEESSSAPPEPEPACNSFLPALAVLPDSFPTSPLYYADDELARIDGTNCAEYAKRMLQQFESDYTKLIDVLRAYDELFVDAVPTTAATIRSNEPIPPYLLRNRLRLSERVTFDAYKWALCNIYSRSSDFMMHTPTQNAALMDDVPKFRVIAPLFDMINHDFNSGVQHSLDLEAHSSGDLSVFNGSDRPIETGDEIRLSYGNFPNEKLLLIYHFVLEQNPYDAVAIYAPLNPSDPLYVSKCRLLQGQCNVDDSNEPHLLRKPQAALTADDETSPVQSILPVSLMSVLRLTGVQSVEELMSVVRADAGESDGDRQCASPTQPSGIPMISIENERSALVALQNALYAMSRQLALNLISDEGLRQGQGPSSPVPAKEEDQISLRVRSTNTINSRIMCQSEYEILQLALAEIHDRLSALDGDTSDQQ